MSVLEVVCSLRDSVMLLGNVDFITVFMEVKPQI